MNLLDAGLEALIAPRPEGVVHGSALRLRWLRSA